MTRDEAVSITQMILNTWVKPDWTDGQTETFVNKLVPYDAEYMVHAVALADKELRARPPFSELYGFYRAAKSEAASRQDPPPPTPRTRLPLWVKRWVCARYLYAAFGRDQDLRVFPEHRDWAGPDGQTMPVDEWVTEAQALDDGRAWQALRAVR
jgi:hypothetical protein